MLVLVKGGQGSGHFGHKGRKGQVGGSIADKELTLVRETIKKHAVPWRSLPFSKENWDKEFPDGKVITPIGEVILGENQFDKFKEKGRGQYFGLIKPTLENPSYIISEKEPADSLKERASRGEKVIRNAVIKFIRAFKDSNGKIIGFCDATVSRDGVEVMISASPRKLNRIVRAVRYGGMILPLRKSAVPFMKCQPNRVAAKPAVKEQPIKDGCMTYVYSTAKSADGNEIYAICSERLHKAILGD